MPTKVMSWLAMASNLSFSASGSPLVLWACKMFHAMVPVWAASTSGAKNPSAASAAGALSSAGTHCPRR